MRSMAPAQQEAQLCYDLQAGDLSGYPRQEISAIFAFLRTKPPCWLPEK